MYRPADLRTGLANVWGWRQHYDSSIMELPAALTKSDTGQYFQDVHPLLTLDNILAIAPDFDDLATFYTWLQQKTEASTLTAVRKFWDTKMAEQSAKNILESKALFNGAGRLNDLIENQDNLVGFEIVPIRANGVTTKIDKIGLQMVGSDAVTMYLMHSSRVEPLKTIELTRERTNGGVEWFTPTEDLYLPYSSDDTDAGGSWYLVYDQTKLIYSSQAVNRTKDWSKAPCTSCDADEAYAYNIWSKYLEIHPFKTVSPGSDFSEDFDEDYSVGTTPLTLWDIENNVYTYDTSYGLNLKLTIECDITDIIIEQRRAFQNILGLQVAIDMLREFATNPNFNINRQQQHLKAETILYELDGDSQGYKKSGLVFELSRAMEAASIDFTDMSRVCFPCKKRGVRFRAI